MAFLCKFKRIHKTKLGNRKGLFKTTKQLRHFKLSVKINASFYSCTLHTRKCALQSVCTVLAWILTKQYNTIFVVWLLMQVVLKCQHEMKMHLLINHCIYFLNVNVTMWTILQCRHLIFLFFFWLVLNPNIIASSMFWRKMTDFCLDLTACNHIHLHPMNNQWIEPSPCSSFFSVNNLFYLNLHHNMNYVSLWL